MAKIGVFDSGIGGLSVARAIQEALPRSEVVFVNDQENIPYGTKTPAHLLKLVVPILEALEEQGCSIIVLACNTVSTTIVSQIREQLHTPIVAIEPMVKPAAEKTKTKVIAVCATPTTLSSARYKWLKKTYAGGVKVLEPDCSNWTTMIERNAINQNNIRKEIEAVCQNGADMIVLGCTHYHWIEDLIKEIARDRAEVIQPEQAVIKQLKRVLQQTDGTSRLGPYNS